MYFLEYLIKKFTKKREFEDFIPEENNQENKDYEACEHLFMPIDSTGKILACTKCGFILRVGAN